MMSAILIMLLLYSVSSTGSATQSGGGINMRLGKNGLNRAITYVMDHVLVPYIENDLEVDDYEISLGAATLLIEKLALNMLEGQHGSLEILEDNKIRITLGFSKLGLETNLTRIASSGTIYAPDTVVFFDDCTVKVTFSLGLHQNNDITLDSCKATIGSFSAQGVLGTALEGAYTLGGSDSIASMVEKICPTIEEITNENLEDILSVEDTVEITSGKYGDISINMKLISATTETNFIDIRVEVTTGTDPFVGTVKFPANQQGQADHDARLLINDILLGKLAKYTIQDDVFKGFNLQKNIQRDMYKIQVNETSIKNAVTSSSEGMSIISNVTFNIFTKDNCLEYQLMMDSVTPLVFAYNDTLILIETDKNRLQKYYKVSHWNMECHGQEKPDSGVQIELLRHTDTEYEKRLIGQSFQLKLPKGKWYGFKEPRINTLKDGMIFSSTIRVGNIDTMKEVALKHVYNKHYVTNMTVYVDKDGEKVKIEGRKSTVDSGTMTTINIHLLASSIIFLFHSFNEH